MTAGRVGAERSGAAGTLTLLRRFLLAMLVGGCAGTLAELLLSKHYEDAWQDVPLVLLGVALLVTGGYALGRSRAGLRMLQGVMLLFVLSALVGTWLHYRAKMEFALERHPDYTGLALVRESLKGSSPPLLAPGAMIGLGLIGLAWTFRHPRLGTGTGKHLPGENS